MPLTATLGSQTAAPARRPHHGALSTCTLRHASDDGLVALTRAGSDRAFTEIMRRYQRPLQFYCLHLVGGARAEDAVQQAFMQAFVSLRDGNRREIALRPWLYRIARNCAIDLLRKQPVDHDELDPDFDGMSQTPGVYEQKEELARIVAAIQALPEGQRRALTLRELEGRSYGEISAELGHTDSGVRQLIFRARTALRNLGALTFPLGSIRWRLLGSSSSPAIADAHQVAATATVSSTGGGTVLQAAASAVAATVTLLATGVPAERHGGHAVTQRASSGMTVQQPPAALPQFARAVALSAIRHSGARKPRRNIVNAGGTAAPLSSEVAPEPVTLTASVAPATQPAASPTDDPPSELTLADPSGSQGPVAPAALGGSGVSATDTAVVDATSTPGARSSTGGATAGGKGGASGQSFTTTLPLVKPAVKPVVSPVRADPSSTIAAFPSPAKPATPSKPVLPAKSVLPRRPTLTKAPASPLKPSTPKV